MNARASLLIELLTVAILNRAYRHFDCDMEKEEPSLKMIGSV